MPNYTRDITKKESVVHNVIYYDGNNMLDKDTIDEDSLPDSIDICIYTIQYSKITSFCIFLFNS